VKQGRLNIGVVGSQIAGIAMAQALSHAGHQVVAVSAGALDTDERIEVLLPLAKKLSDEKILAAADLVLLAVPSSEIESTVLALSDFF
jgi:Glycerol-3-phosphate dehydrogenase